MNRSSSLFYSKPKVVSKNNTITNFKQLNINSDIKSTTTKNKSNMPNTKSSTSRMKILNTTRNSSFFKLSTKTISTKPTNLNLNALNNFMSKNEFYFDFNKWQQTRSSKTSKNIIIKNNYLNHSVTISKLRFLELFRIKEFEDFNFNLNFFDQLSSFKNALRLTEVTSNKMKSPSYVPE